MTCARRWCSVPFPCVPALMAGVLALLSAPALGVAVTHTSLASFQQATRADVILEPFAGPQQIFLVPLAVASGGYAFAVDSPLGVLRDVLGVSAPFDEHATAFTFTGRPVTAFGATIRVVNENTVQIAGTVNITLSTGEVFTVPISVNSGAGTFVGITSTQPFTSLSVDSPLHSPPSSSATWEWIDDVRVGTAASAVFLTDHCADAVTVNPITAAQHAFSTASTGATATFISGSCPLVAALDSGPDVWVRFVPAVHGSVTISTCGSTFDTVLRVFDSCGPMGTGAGATQIACNDDFCATAGGGNTSSQVQFRAQAGEDYLVRVSGYNNATGSGTLTFSVVPDCAADFNHTGGPQTLQDIFDFLTAWFGGC